MALVLSRTWLYLILLFWFQFLLCLLTCYTCYQHWFENPAPVSLTVVCYRVDQSAAVWGDVDEFVSSVEPGHRRCVGTHSSGGQYGELSREVFSKTGTHNCSPELPNTSETNVGVRLICWTSLYVRFPHIQMHGHIVFAYMYIPKRIVSASFKGCSLSTNLLNPNNVNLVLWMGYKHPDLLHATSGSVLNKPLVNW